MRIDSKICGITRPEDAHAAVQLGANALGFVFFAGSKRCISPQAARQIIDTLPPFVSTVGLFVNETADNIHAILRHVPLHILQFHGDETPEFCRQFHRPYFKAVRVQAACDIIQAAQHYADARALLFDAHVEGAYGGTGHCFDWNIIPKDISQSWILSGGLNPNNLAQALQHTGARSVDVSSGVEASAGIKCHEKMAKFLSICQSIS